jgi:hypothetical protein
MAGVEAHRSVQKHVEVLSGFLSVCVPCRCMVWRDAHVAIARYCCFGVLPHRSLTHLEFPYCIEPPSHIGIALSKSFSSALNDESEVDDVFLKKIQCLKLTSACMNA